MLEPRGAVHPGLVAELFYMVNDLEAFERAIMESKPAFDYVMQLERTFKSFDIEDMQALALATRAKWAAFEVLSELKACA